MVSWKSRLESGMALCCLQWWEYVLSHVSNVPTRVRRKLGEFHLQECIRPRHTGSTSGFIVWWGISYNSQSHLVSLQVKYTVSATSHMLLTPRYCHLFDRKVMCFFSNTTHVHVRLLRRNVLISRFHRSLANWTRMEHDEEATYSFSKACHNHCRIATTGARYLVQSIARWHSAPLWRFACENIRLLFRQKGYTVYWCDCLGTPYCDIRVSIDLNLLSYTPTRINCRSHQFQYNEFVVEGVLFFSGNVSWKILLVLYDNNFAFNLDPQ